MVRSYCAAFRTYVNSLKLPWSTGRFGSQHVAADRAVGWLSDERGAPTGRASLRGHSWEPWEACDVGEAENRMALPWSKPQRGNLILLGAAFIECRSLPIRRLARALCGPGPEQRQMDKQLREFLGNRLLDTAALDAALCSHLQFVLGRFRETPFIPVMLDWVFFEGRAVLWAQIPYRGRAIPLGSAVYHFPLEPHEPGRTEAEQLLLHRLRACWPSFAPEPLLLVDRGFDKGPLLRWLVEQGFRFSCRIQEGGYLYDVEGRLLNDVYDRYGNLERRGPLHPENGEVLTGCDSRIRRLGRGSRWRHRAAGRGSDR